MLCRNALPERQGGRSLQNGGRSVQIGGRSLQIGGRSLQNSETFQRRFWGRVYGLQVLLPSVYLEVFRVIRARLA